MQIHLPGSKLSLFGKGAGAFLALPPAVWFLISWDCEREGVGDEMS